MNTYQTSVQPGFGRVKARLANRSPFHGGGAALIPTVAALAAFGLTLGAFAQGSIDVNNLQSTGRVAIGRAGNYYGGVLSFELWELNAAAVPGNISGVDPFAAYRNLQADGFSFEATFQGINNQSVPGPGLIALGELDMREVSPPGGNCVLALAMWNTADPSLPWAEVNASGALWAGLIAFVNPTADYTAHPAPTPPLLAAGPRIWSWLRQVQSLPPSPWRVWVRRRGWCSVGGGDSGPYRARASDPGRDDLKPHHAKGAKGAKRKK